MKNINYKDIPVDHEFYSEDHDPEADHNDSYKCNNDCGETVEIDGDVCQDCYDAE